MGSANRCDIVAQQKTSEGDIGPVNGRCGSNFPNVEYWKAPNNSSTISAWSDISTMSGGEKTPPCSNHGTEGVFEDIEVGQSTCNGHRNGSGAYITAINNETIIQGGNTSFVAELYSQINTELNSRRQHNIYANKETVTVPVSGRDISVSDLNNAIEIINDYAINDNISTIEGQVQSGNIVKKSNFNALKENFNNAVVKNCICYSDCNGYSVCYCYGNCYYY